MLIIKTDTDNIHWLRYVLDEFIHINSALFPIQVLSLDAKETNPYVLYYCTAVQDGLSVYSHQKPFLSDEIDYLRDDLFILRGTDTQDDFTIPYDLFWNAFVFLSRYEEYASEISGKLIRSYSRNHPRKDKKSFELPIVNILFNELESSLKDLFPTLCFGAKGAMEMELSHDVDYVSKTVQLRIKQTLFNGYNLLKSLWEPSVFFANLKKTFLFAFSTPSYWCFDYWQQLEMKRGVRSTFYIYVKSGKKNFLAWLIDPSYDLKTNVQLQKKLKELIENGFYIGLHGSYYSAKSKEQLQNEKQILEDIVGEEITKTRQHWLNYYEQITPYLHESLFEKDSTVGWNDRIGFRSGVASPYHPYDHRNQRPLAYIIIPQIIMDSHLFDYRDDHNSIESAKMILERSMIHARKPHVSISWHQRVCSSDYNWHKAYEELLNVV